VEDLKSVKDLNAELGATRKENNDLWNAMHHVANFIRVRKMPGSPGCKSFQSYLNASMLK
jgi:hypothetical protein